MSFLHRSDSSEWDQQSRKGKGGEDNLASKRLVVMDQWIGKGGVTYQVPSHKQVRIPCHSTSQFLRESPYEYALVVDWPNVLAEIWVSWAGRGHWVVQRELLSPLYGLGSELGARQVE